MAAIGGRVVPIDQAFVPLEDRGFLFSESAYEVYLAVHGRLFEEELHRARLLRSTEGIGIDPRRFEAVLSKTLAALLPVTKKQPALVYIQVTGGAGPRDHLPKVDPEPSVYGTVRPFSWAKFLEARAMGLRAIRHEDNRWPLATYKTTQLLGSVLAKRRARAEAADEVVYLDREGFVLEGGSTNVFVVKNGQVGTPPLSRNLLPGITRAVLLRDHKDLVREQLLRSEDLDRADEIFLASTTRPAIPILKLDGRPVADGREGPITRDIFHRMADALELPRT